MDPESRRHALERLQRAVERPNEETRASWQVPIDRYLEPKILEAEERTLFRKRPMPIVHSSDLRREGDYASEVVGGTPVLVVRTARGARAFVNACRHRGAKLLAGSGHCGKAITCPYHAWSYRLDGSLFGVPHRERFGELDESSLGLVPIACQERHGFVWVQLDGTLDVGTYLGSVVDGDLERFDLRSHVVVRRVEHEAGANWKLVMDAFAEGYHLKSLHRDTLARFFLDVAVVDDCAPHVRQIGGRKKLLEVSGQSALDAFSELTTVFYNLFPATVIVFHPEWISHMVLLPLAVDRVRVVHRALARPEAWEGALRERIERSVDLIDGQVFAKEDLAIAASVQESLSSRREPFLLGGLEEGMHLFHDAWERAMGAPAAGPDEGGPRPDPCLGR